jgi:hypothetical protein
MTRTSWMPALLFVTVPLLATAEPVRHVVDSGASALSIFVQTPRTSRPRASSFGSRRAD